MTQSFSDLFYRVIHNKYLFNLIFHHLHSRYEGYSQTKFHHVGDDDDDDDDDDNLYEIKRIRFKDIISLDFMVKKKLYQLLKCKLEANEYIEAYRLRSGWINNIYDQDRELSIEILKLLLKSTSIRNKDRIFSICSFYPELIQVATDSLSQYSIQVQPDMIQEAFNNSTVPQIKALLDSFYCINSTGSNSSINSSNNCSNSGGNNKLKRNIDELYNNTCNDNNCITSYSSNHLLSSSNNVINQFKNKIVKKAFGIYDQLKRTSVLALILSNSQYYNIPPSSHQSTTISPISKRIKSSQDSNSSTNADISFDFDLIDICDIVHKVISFNIQNQLFDLNYYYIPEPLNKYKDQINNIINSNNSSSYNSSNNKSNNKRPKDLLQLFIDHGIANKYSLQQLEMFDFSNFNHSFLIALDVDDWGLNIMLERYSNSIDLEQCKKNVEYLQLLNKEEWFTHGSQLVEKVILNKISTFESPYSDYQLNYIEILESLKNINNNNNNNYNIRNKDNSINDNSSNNNN